MKQARRFAWLVMLIADAGLLAWGAMAALAPDYLLGPGSKPILAAGYEGFTERSWSGTHGHVSGDRRVHDECSSGCTAHTSWRSGCWRSPSLPRPSAVVSVWAWWALLVGNTIAFVSAMTYDWTVGAIGPFELTEYLGLALIWGALAVTAPFRAAGRPVPSPRL